MVKKAQAIYMLFNSRTSSIVPEQEGRKSFFVHTFIVQFFSDIFLRNSYNNEAKLGIDNWSVDVLYLGQFS